MTQKLVLISAILSFALGLALRAYETRKYGRQTVDPKRLKANQVAYSILLAYPFCALYVWAQSLL